MSEMREVEPPIIGRRIRFIPYSKQQRMVCMRVEIYGCPWKGELTNLEKNNKKMFSFEI